MGKDNYSAKLEDMTLGNIAEGKLEQRFQEILGELTGILACLDDYSVDKAGKANATVKITINFGLSESGDIAIDVGAELKRPDHVRTGNTVYCKRGEWKVWENEPKQQSFPETSKVAVRAIGDRVE